MIFLLTGNKILTHTPYIIFIKDDDKTNRDCYQNFSTSKTNKGGGQVRTKNRISKEQKKGKV